MAFIPNNETLEAAGEAAGECVLLIYNSIKKICCCKEKQKD
tara:strand:+ start:369 stop:491 length:123 start_codon:yes stop_codon:yes gene_type:complete